MEILAQVKGVKEYTNVAIDEDSPAAIYNAVCTALDFELCNVEIEYRGSFLDKEELAPIGIAMDDIVIVSLSRRKEARKWLEDHKIEATESALTDAISRRRWEEVCNLIQAGVESPDLMKDVIKFGSADAVVKILDIGVDVNMQPAADRSSALHHACDYCDADIAEFLLGRGANVNAQQYSGQTALHLAAMHGSVSVCTILLAHGADPNAVNKKQETPLHQAALRGHCHVIKFLIQHNASIDHPCNQSLRTPLHYAGLQCYDEAYTLLVEAGADPDRKDAGGKTASALYADRMKCITNARVPCMPACV
eukprot:TRINITY_DN28007_c0_g1_i1.p1 TRINITY_DN28007_c0_g1~~TRINITY_DN28007_c0_g1_i1.p1  ORF type:complete len:308 (+),score=58.47 TRINITY_DN28007_c0_g1_i1:49-972(+)